MILVISLYDNVVDLYKRHESERRERERGRKGRKTFDDIWHILQLKASHQNEITDKNSYNLTRHHQTETNKDREKWIEMEEAEIRTGIGTDRERDREIERAKQREV